MTSTSDWLMIEGLKVKTKVGIHRWEQAIEQTLCIDIRVPIQLPTHPVLLEQSIDYDVLCKRVTTFVSTKSFDLIENVALEVYNLLQQEFTISKAEIRVSKPLAVGNARNITIEIFR